MEPSLWTSSMALTSASFCSKKKKQLVFSPSLLGIHHSHASQWLHGDLYQANGYPWLLNQCQTWVGRYTLQLPCPLGRTTLSCTPYHLPEVTSRTEALLSTPVTCSLMLIIGGSHLYPSPLALSGVTPQMNHLLLSFLWGSASGELKTNLPSKENKWWAHVHEREAWNQGMDRDPDRDTDLQTRCVGSLKPSTTKVTHQVQRCRDKQAAGGEAQPSGNGVFITWTPCHHP